MPSRRPSLRAFSLVEALVSVVLLAVGIVSVMEALSNISRSEIRTQGTTQLNRLAHQKFDELRATGEAITGTGTGNFEEENLPNIRWSAESDVSGTENLYLVTVTVTRDSDTATAKGLIYVEPESTQTSAASGGGQ